MFKIKIPLLAISASIIGMMTGCQNGNGGRIPAEQIITDEQSLTLKVGETKKIHAAVIPENTTDTAVLYESLSPEIASVTDKGEVTGLSEGETAIRISAGKAYSDCSVTVYSPEPPEIGDFYYSDGSWSTELDTEKKVIGIVFWCGDPGKDDPTLRQEHPDCTNGLAIAINGEQESGWQPYYLLYDNSISSWLDIYAPEYQTIITETGTQEEARGNLNKMIGYNNTKAIEIFNAAPENAQWKMDAVEKAVQYRETVPAPETSSDWYLPSAKELTLLAYGETDKNIYYYDHYAEITEIVNQRLSLLENSQLLCTHDFIWTYWAANESNEQEAFNVSHMSGGVFYSRKGIINYYARFILAF